jgi:hypothetical protein
MFTLEVLKVVVTDVAMLLENLTTQSGKPATSSQDEGKLSVMTKLEMYLTKILSFSIKLRIARLRLLLKKEALCVCVCV